MTPQKFIAKWGPGGPAFHLNEEQGAQSHFIDLCELLAVPKPGSEAGYLFEEKNALIGGRTGYADVFKSGAFAWENKAPGKNLDAALKQLLTYSLALSNPPILVVCDRLTIRIHTQFTGHPTETFNVALAELDQPEKLALLRRIWTDPESFRPKKTSRDITETAARSFATLADGLRKRGPDKSTQPLEAQTHADEVAHFLTQCLFCFFAEDVGLLPGRMFEGLVNNRQLTSDKLTIGLRNLFTVMRDGGLYGNDDIPWFNGGLFKKIKVPALNVLDMTELRNAAGLNWSAIDVSIFGTLFERGLDPSKRSQLGAHYTDPATIMRIVEPVLKRPLLKIWEQTAQEIRGLMAKNTKKGDKHYKAAKARFIGWLDQLSSYRVLDPACGSGNFLFLGLKTLKDIEHQSHIEAAMLGLDREADLVTGPHNMLGIELNEYAAELARVTVWIGELQWRLQHGYEFKTNPVLEPLDHIECRDALITIDPGRVEPVEAMWPKASVVIGNPPFLGDKMMRSELGDAYTDTLRQLYKDRVPGGADLVMFWFEKARAQIEQAGLGAAGLVATNSIRQRGNRPVMERIQESTRIYDAWADMPWVNEGAAVRVSLVCFGHATQQVRLDGTDVEKIFADLKAQTTGTSAVDLTTAQPLAENADASYFGFCLAGPFKVPSQTAAAWLRQPNVNGQPNSLVLKPIYNGSDITRRWAGNWTIDFGARLSEADAALFEKPFEYATRHIKTVRAENREAQRAKNWWRHGRPRPELRDKLKNLTRYIATAETAKYRLFVFFPVSVAPEHSLIVIPRADDVTFGLLSSKAHAVWSLARGGRMGKGNDPRYNSLAAFLPFPFPGGLTPADTAHQNTETIEGGALIPAGLSASNVPPAQKGRAQVAMNTGAVRAAAEAIARAAKRLNDLREAWLNPPEWTQRVPEVVPLGMTVSPYPDRILPKDGFEKELAERTLTKLYNLRPAWLDAAHKELDRAVAAAYGWADYSADMPDEEILKRLLALNLARST
ncbi:DNA methyltransferase [Polaromonas sp. YR568]|uniref:class I SAM-dependent DNA methyltransferase n=1 Tax=Polaromonas sp. YR568 TaxID=1855301 RepID=UPI003137A75E